MEDEGGTGTVSRTKEHRFQYRRCSGGDIKGVGAFLGESLVLGKNWVGAITIIWEKRSQGEREGKIPTGELLVAFQDSRLITYAGMEERWCVNGKSGGVFDRPRSVVMRKRLRRGGNTAKWIVIECGGS